MSDSLAELQRAAIAFRDARDWEQFHRPKELALALQIEAAELAELFLWKTDAECQEALGTEELKARLREEAADMLIFLLYLAEAAGISLGPAVVEKLAVNERKYPAERSRGSAAKYSELD